MPESHPHPVCDSGDEETHLAHDEQQQSLVELRRDALRDMTDAQGDAIGTKQNPTPSPSAAESPTAATAPSGGGDTPMAKEPAPTFSSLPRRTKLIVLGTFVVMTNEAIAMTMLFPYVGLLVARLSPDIDVDQAGQYSGLVVGGFNLAQALCAAWIGRLSDRYGRRPLIVLGLVFSTVFSLSAGLASHVWQLVLARCLYGAANANAPLAKTIASEAATTKTETLTFSVISAGWQFGATVGPMLGGVLYDPSSHWPGVFGGTVFDTYPALLPAVVGAVYPLFAALVTVYIVPETNKNAQPLPFGWARRLFASREVEDAEDGAGTELQAVVAGAAEEPPTDTTEPTSSPTVSVEGQDATSPPPTEHFGFVDMMKHERLRRVLLLYVLCCVVNTSFIEVFPLLVILPTGLGGLGKQATTTGIVFVAFAVASAAATTVFPRFVASQGRLKTLRMMLMFLAVVTTLTPLVANIVFPLNSVALTVVCAVLLSPRAAGMTMAFNVTTMGIAAVAPRAHLGAATGMSHSTGNVCRGLAPMLLTWIFARSVQAAAAEVKAAEGRMPPLIGAGFPLNRWLAFLVLGSLMVFAVVLTRGMTNGNLERTAEGQGAKEVGAKEDGEEHVEEEEEEDVRREAEQDAAPLVVKS